MTFKIAGVVIYLTALVIIGVLASRRMNDIRDYYAGGKRFGYWAAAFSARATGESAWLLLGLTGMGAAVGVKAFWVVVGEVIGVTVAWLLMCGRFKVLTDRYDAITIPDYLEGRFADTTQWIRKVSAIALVIFVTIYVSAQIDATGKAFESFLDMNYFAGAIIGFVVVLAYIVSGGFVAVVWSDVFQGILMVVGLVVLPVAGIVLAYQQDGGFMIIEGLREIDPNLLSWSGGAGWGLESTLGVLGLTLIGLGFLGSPQIFVRFLSLKGVSEVTPGSRVAIVWTLLADSGAVLTGIIGRYLLTDSGTPIAETALGASGEQVLPLLVEYAMPAFVVGLFIAVVLSAIMSTVDSLLVVASSAAVRDVYQKVWHPEASDAELMGLGRRVTFVLALAALVVALSVAVLSPTRTIFWFVIFGWSGIAATFCPTMILSLYWSGFTKRGALGAMITGFLSVPLFKFAATMLPLVGDYFGALGELPPAFLASMLVGIALSMTDPKQQEAAAIAKPALLEAAEQARP